MHVLSFNAHHVERTRKLHEAIAAAGAGLARLRLMRGRKGRERERGAKKEKSKGFGKPQRFVAACVLRMLGRYQCVHEEGKALDVCHSNANSWTATPEVS